MDKKYETTIFSDSSIDLKSSSTSKRKNGKVLLVTACTGLGFNMAPHFGMYQILNYLRSNDIDCDMYDRDLAFFGKTELDETKVLENITKGIYDVIGISVAQDKVLGQQKMIDDLDMIWRMKEAAEISNKIPVFVAGGQAATLNYRQWLDLGIDLIILGFGEKTLYDICKKYFMIPEIKRKVSELIKIVKTINGVSYKKPDGSYAYTPTPPVDKELFNELFLEFPKTYEMPHQIFWDILKETSADQDLGASEFVYENVRLYTTSHCPRRCGFCNSGQFLPEMTAPEQNLMLDKKGLRFSKGRQRLVRLDADELMELVMFNIKKYGARSFLFSDDDFALKSKVNRVREFCNLVVDYKNKGLMNDNVSFHCQSHVTDYLRNNRIVDDELIKGMALAGFGSVSVGVETFTDGIIGSPSINKIGYKSEHAQAVLDTMIKYHIIPQVNVILGVPEYTPEDLLYTVDVALKYIIKGCDLSLSRQLLALPGAPIYESGLYEVVYEYWTHPVTREEIKIPDYFVPNDPIVAKAMDVFDKEAQKNLDKVITKMNWGEKTPPKRVIAISALACLPRLLNRDDVTPKYEKVLNNILEGKYRQNAGFSYQDI